MGGNVVGETNIGLSVTRWGRLRELVQAFLVAPPTPTLASLQRKSVCQHIATLFIVALQVFPIQSKSVFFIPSISLTYWQLSCLEPRGSFWQIQLLVSAATLWIVKSSVLFLSNSGAQDPRKLCVRKVYTQLVAKVGLWRRQCFPKQCEWKGPGPKHWDGFSIEPTIWVWEIEESESGQMVLEKVKWTKIQWP